MSHGASVDLWFLASGRHEKSPKSSGMVEQFVNFGKHKYWEHKLWEHKFVEHKLGEHKANGGKGACSTMFGSVTFSWRHRLRSSFIQK